MITYSANLPISEKKGEIIKSIAQNGVTIVIGDTGSGKTTQIPKMCLELQQKPGGLIGCTQPRRMAAVMAARRISSEMGEELGRQVGYKIRFDEKPGLRQRIKIMTDGILLMEAQTDPLLRRYDYIILDEAHERSLNIDFLLGIIKNLIPRRPELKVIVTSASIDALQFSHYFDKAPIIEVSGRQYPIETSYHPAIAEEGDEVNYVEGSVRTVEEITSFHPPGDILIFMPTEADILESCSLLEGRYGRDILVLPFFARLNRADQEKVFKPTSQTKIVVATNIAETSLTIPGIRYVIDSGLHRISEYNPRTKTTSLPIRPISASSADQRKGRCGRLQNGVCFRLYSEEDYHSLPLHTPPELLRSNLAEVILRMLYLGLGDPASFPFLNPPPLKYINDGIDTLLELEACVSTVKDTAPNREGRTAQYLKLTPRGRMMARLPLDPRLSRIIIEAKKENCVHEVTIIAAALTIQHPSEASRDDRTGAEDPLASLRDKNSDFMTLLRIYQDFDRLIAGEASKSASRKYCRERQLSFKRMREWRDIVAQLQGILRDHGITDEPSSADYGLLYENIHKSILSGYLSQIAVKKKKNLFLTRGGREVYIFPGSELYNAKGTDWIVAAEMIETSRLFARRAARIESSWIEELAGKRCRFNYRNPRWDKSRKEVMADLQVSLYGLIIVPNRLVAYGPVNPREANDIFIREAIMDSEDTYGHSFLAHNRELQMKIESWEDKLRRRDIIAGDEQIFEFYRQRLPEVYNLRGLEKLIRQKNEDLFLRMKEEDLLQRPVEIDPVTYPDGVSLGGKPIGISYLFAPGNPADGITLRIPLGLLAEIPPRLPESLVPAIWEEKLYQLLKGLPKNWRKLLHPLKETHRSILRDFDPTRGILATELSRFIRARWGIDIPPTAWSTDRIDDYLQPRISLVDADGVEQFASRDVDAVRARASSSFPQPIFEQARKNWEREGIITWDFPDLPEEAPLELDGRIHGWAYPALSPGQVGADLRLFGSRHEALLSHREGLYCLYQTQLSKYFQSLRKDLALSPQMKVFVSSWQDPKTFASILQRQVAKELLVGAPRRAEDFFRLCEETRALILPKAREIIDRIEPLLRARHETAIHLTGLKGKNRDSRPGLAYLALLEKELTQLLPPDFLDRFTPPYYDRLLRFMKALSIRADRGLNHLERAWEKTKEIDHYGQILSKAREECKADSSPEAMAALDELFWMIEEYKISLFAQELKTAIPISRKRLEEKIQELSH